MCMSCYWKASQPLKESRVLTAEGTRQIRDNSVQMCCDPRQVGRWFWYQSVKLDFILTHQGFYCRTTPNTITFAQKETGSFSVSVFQTRGSAL